MSLLGLALFFLLTFTCFFLSPIIYTSPRDFDASLYLCEEAFGLLPLDTLERLAGTLLLYPYIFTLLLLSGMVGMAALQNLRYVIAALEIRHIGGRQATQKSLCCRIK